MGNFSPFCYRAWCKKMDWSTGQLSDDPKKVIYDADSGYIFSDLGRRQYDNSHYRFWGCNAYEMNSADPVLRAKAVAGRDWVRTQILAKQVFVRSMGYDDKYGRILIVVWLNEADFGDNVKSINRQLIDLGHAVPYMGELV